MTIISVRREQGVRLTVCIAHLGEGTLFVNIQNSHGKAKTYQVRQVIQAIDKLERREQ